MNFALLGDDPAVMPLVRAIARHARHRLVCAAQVKAIASEVIAIVPGVRILPGWDGIITAGAVEAVLVCGADETVLEGARQLASAGKTLVIVPRSAQGSTWIYELGLIRDERGVVLAPVFIDRLRPTTRRLRQAIASGMLGRVLYLRIDREIVSPAAGSGSTLIAVEQIEDALLHDVDLLRFLAGDYSRVSAVHSGISADRVAAAGVTLSGDQIPEGTWTARGTMGTGQFQLVIAGEKGEITVAGAGQEAAWTLRCDRISLADDVEPPSSDEGEWFLESIEGFPEKSTGAADWTDLVRAFEVVDAARTSVRRRRAIDLHFGTTSERNIFKSQMTALGCLVMTMTLFGAIFLLLVMPLLDIRGRAQLEAERAGSIVRRAEFKPQSSDLTDEGSTHVRTIARSMAGAHFPILIEESPESDRKLDERRRASVAGLLTRQGAKDAADRTQVMPIVGEWYPQALRVVRVLAFAPLALFLLLQAFLFLARPARSGTSEPVA